MSLCMAAERRCVRVDPSVPLMFFLGEWSRGQLEGVLKVCLDKSEVKAK